MVKQSPLSKRLRGLMDENERDGFPDAMFVEEALSGLEVPSEDSTKVSSHMSSQLSSQMSSQLSSGLHTKDQTTLDIMSSSASPYESSLVSSCVSSLASPSPSSPMSPEDTSPSSSAYSEASPEDTEKTWKRTPEKNEVTTEDNHEDTDDDRPTKEFIETSSPRRLLIIQHLVKEALHKEPVLATVRGLQADLGVGKSTVERLLAELIAEKIIHTKGYQKKTVQGTHIWFMEPARSWLFRWVKNEDKHEDSSGDTVEDTTTMKTALRTPGKTPQKTHKIERLEKEFYLSRGEEEQEGKRERREEIPLDTADIRFNFPALANVGFGTHQLRQIWDNLAKLGKATDNVLLGMEYANAWLEIGALVDAKGKAVEDPLGYVFSSLARTGYFAKPKGFVTPEEVAAKDAHERAEAKKAAVEIQEQADFDVWLTGLTESEKDALLAGAKGPVDKWLRHKWRLATQREV